MRGHRDTVDPDSASPTADINKSNQFPRAGSLEACQPSVSGGTLSGGLWPHSEAPMRFPGTASSTRRISCAAFALVVAAQPPVHALDPDSPIAQREARKMQAVLEENFQAINEENLKKLLGTTSRYTGTQQEMAEFAAEAKQMFADTDVYMRLVDFELTDFAPPTAYATVIQLTLPANEQVSDDDLANRKLGTTHFRSNSALLPEYELCSYRQRFNFEGGKWKVHRVVSQPVKAQWPRQ
jgi:hypothetical protein